MRSSNAGPLTFLPLSSAHPRPQLSTSPSFMAATPEGRSALQDIFKTAQLIKQRIQSSPNFHLNRSHRKPVQATPPKLDFPVIQPLTSRLIDAGLSRRLAERLSCLYLRRVGEFSEQCQSRFSCAYHSVANNSRGPSLHTAISSLQQSYIALFSKSSKLWGDEQVAKVVNHIQCRNNSFDSRKSKAAFNHEYIPLLEKYFNYNAYPSARDRLLLARKSMMAPRQIEVWFQNHRSRARKQGIPLKKLSSNPLPSKLSLESLEEDMPMFTAPSHGSEPDVCTRPFVDAGTLDSDAQTSKQIIAEPLSFNEAPPSHTFPTVYMPSNATPSNYSTPPFPIITWPRKQRLQQRPNREAIDIDELTTAFQVKLSIRGTCHKSSEYCIWLSTRITRPSKAPHLSLVNAIVPSRPIIQDSQSHNRRRYASLASEPNRCIRQSRYEASRPYRRLSARSVSSSSSSSLSFDSDDGSEISTSYSSRPVTPSVDSPRPIRIYDLEGFFPYSNPSGVYFPFSPDKLAFS